ncbi:MAG TPA: peptidase, partial [Cytophagales bacterium]|nr:peptidase [Cytophagales bacterium]
RWWNQAFEAAGFQDAYRVEMMPEGADPMDVRYNVIQWVHRSTRGWSYGSSVRDPRTGEIIKGHVSLGSLRVRQDYMIAEAILAPYMAGQEVPEEMLEFALARLRQLSAHEVGHTLGLSHNYIASTNNRASVMDYPHPYIQLKEDGTFDLSEAYDVNIGEWDKVAITFGYAEYPEGTDEKAAGEQVLLDALADGIRFISDQDARPQGGAHAYAHLWDSGESPTAELNRVMEVRQKALEQFGQNNIPEGTPLAMMEQTLVPLYLFHRYQVEAAVKLLGGFDYNYAVRGDGQSALTPVSAADQQAALEALLATLKPEHLAVPESILDQLPPMPLAFGRNRESFKGRTSVMFDPLVAAENGATATLSLMLHPARANRLVLQNSRNGNALGLDDVLGDLLITTWKKTPQPGYMGEVQRTVNMVTLRHIMNLSLDKGASDQSRAMAYASLMQLMDWLKTQTEVGNRAWAAHYQYALLMMKQWMAEPEPFTFPKPADVPPGSPIGSHDHSACGMW